MVSQDSSSQSQSNNNILHEFVVTSNSNLTLNQFENHHFDAYGTDSVDDIVHHSQLSSDESDRIPQDRHLIDLLGSSNERLSLSLGSVPCRQRELINPLLLNPNYLMIAAKEQASHIDYTTAYAPPSWSPLYGTEQSFAVVGSSKYLQPAQSLLEEMLSVGGNEIHNSNEKFMEKFRRKVSFSLSSKLKAQISNSDQLFTDEKHGDYVNFLKLISLLEEVERRYEEYTHHMDELVSSFEAIAGSGAGKSYTTLALLAMSKHFCRLRNAILSQIHVTKQKTVKEMPKISSRLSQLSLFDQQNRIIMQNSTTQVWRPLRGLPETSVTVLRAWLFEHFLHPYPNDSEKLMLASQTGLSKNQVSNWFINARVRLWKPMIEEIYKEEFEESSTESDHQLVTNGFTDLGD